VALNPLFFFRTKYIEIDCHFVQEKLVSDKISIAFVGTMDQLANLFTKTL